MNSENKLTLAKLSNGAKTKTRIVLIVLELLLAVGFIGSIFTGGNIIIAIIFAALLVFLAFLSFKKIRVLKKQKIAMDNYKDYIPRLSVDEEKSLEKLALSMGSPYEKVESEIDLLIKLGLIKNAFIDKEKKVLVLSNIGLYEKTPETVMVTVKCECCCGTTEIPTGTVGTCQFCGSPISSK